MTNIDVNWAAVAPVIVLAVAFVLYCEWDLAGQEEVNYLPKWAWAIVCVVSVPLGGALYLLFGRKG